VFIKHFDLLIVPSNYTLNEVRDLVGNLPPWEVISPGVERKQPAGDLRRSYEPGKPIELIFVGAIQQRKGVLELVKAFARVTCSDTVLHLVGNVSKEQAYTNRVKEAVRAAGLENRVHFHGRMGDSDLHKMYQQADIFLFPSFHEGYGIVVVEAMQHGLPVIVSNVAALPELVQDGINGLLVSPGDVTGIAKAIDDLSCSPEKRKQFSEENVKFAQRANTWEDVQRLFVERVSELMEANT
jgi:glycosyltransferase involved in cell wall biosynthesis